MQHSRIFIHVIKKSNRIAYPEFGTFTVRYHKVRNCRNPKTEAEIQVGVRKTVGFKVAITKNFLMTIGNQIVKRRNNRY